MKRIVLNFLLAIILCACGGLVILVSHMQELFRYSVNSPYAAAFLMFGVAIGLVFAMIIKVIDNYETKLYEGQPLVVFNRDEG